jgi:3-deoxy-D-manno-octulosonic acid kinase
MRSSIQQDGAAFILADADLPEALGPEQFDPEWWAKREAAEPLIGGRGGITSLHVQAIYPALHGSWILRHYRRGGYVARMLGDLYLSGTPAMSRAFREWQLLARCTRLELPVPRPVAACVMTVGPFVRQDLITWQIPDAVALSAALDRGDEVDWRSVGVAIGRCHAAGLDHADLNAHNLMLSPQGVMVLDLDRGRLRTPAKPWQQANLQRLRRSLEKLARIAGRQVAEADWDALLEGHSQSHPASS